MDYGIQTWDANGNPNNTGIVRVLVKGFVNLAYGAQSGTYTYDVPPPYRLDYYVQEIIGTTPQTRRRISVSGGTVTVTAVANNDFSAGTFSTFAANVIIFLRT